MPLCHCISRRSLSPAFALLYEKIAILGKFDISAASRVIQALTDDLIAPRAPKCSSMSPSAPFSTTARACPKAPASAGDCQRRAVRKPVSRRWHAARHRHLRRQPANPPIFGIHTGRFRLPSHHHPDRISRPGHRRPVLRAFQHRRKRSSFASIPTPSFWQLLTLASTSSRPQAATDTPRLWCTPISTNTVPLADGLSATPTAQNFILA
jgi:hypothetical protein